MAVVQQCKNATCAMVVDCEEETRDMRCPSCKAGRTGGPGWRLCVCRVCVVSSIRQSTLHLSDLTPYTLHPTPDYYTLHPDTVDRLPRKAASRPFSNQLVVYSVVSNWGAVQSLRRYIRRIHHSRVPECLLPKLTWDSYSCQSFLRNSPQLLNASSSSLPIPLPSPTTHGRKYGVVARREAVDGRR